MEALECVLVAHFYPELVQAREELNEVDCLVIVHVKEAECVTQLLELLMDGAPYDLQVVGELRVRNPRLRDFDIKTLPHVG